MEEKKLKNPLNMLKREEYLLNSIGESIGFPKLYT